MASPSAPEALKRKFMRGQILGTDAARGVAVLVGADGGRLEFPLSEWRSSGAPFAGQWVDYVEADGQARQVFASPGAPGSTHVGGTSMGTVFGALSLGCLLFGFIIPLLPTIAALVLGIVGARRAKEDGDETGLVLSRIGWIGAAALLLLLLLLIAAVLLFFGGLMAIAGVAGGWPFVDWN
jgi:hypothetical protein